MNEQRRPADSMLYGIHNNYPAVGPTQTLRNAPDR